MISSDPLLPPGPTVGGAGGGGDGIEHISSLPDALLLHIFRKLDISTLLTCALVSRRWHRRGLTSVKNSIKKVSLELKNLSCFFILL